MFGGFGVFDESGGDVNAGADTTGGDTGGGGESPNLQNTGGGNYAGLYPQQTDPNVTAQSSEDPAAQAANDAAFGANSITQSSTAGNNTAGEINMKNGGGIMGGLFGIFDPKAKRLAKRQRSMARTQSRLAIANAQRAIDQYAADSQIQGQRLQQSYSGRGLGNSSIEQSGMQYFQDSAARKAAELNDNLNLARVGMTVTNSQIAASYAAPYIQLVNGALSLF